METTLLEPFILLLESGLVGRAAIQEPLSSKFPSPLSLFNSLFSGSCGFLVCFFFFGWNLHYNSFLGNNSWEIYYLKSTLYSKKSFIFCLIMEMGKNSNLEKIASSEFWWHFLCPPLPLFLLVRCLMIFLFLNLWCILLFFYLNFCDLLFIPGMLNFMMKCLGILGYFMGLFKL